MNPVQNAVENQDPNALVAAIKASVTQAAADFAELSAIADKANGNPALADSGNKALATGTPLLQSVLDALATIPTV